MNIIRHTDADFAERMKALTAPSGLFDPVVEERTRAIIEAVKARGDAALLEMAEKFDKAKLTADGLAVTLPEMLAASLAADDSLRTAVAAAIRNIENFSRKALRKNWSAKNSQGGKVGEKFDAFTRVGIYIPAGAAPLASTCLMTITLARVAGCKEIVVCSPCDASGQINPALLFAARAAGATEIYRVGGAQAIAAMALGTNTIRRVRKIFGPGGDYVVMAKRLLFGHVAIDLLPGPSEVLVLADETANPKFAAADLLAQAEHGSGHERVWLITTSGKMLKAVEREIAKQLPKLSRRNYIQRALDHNGWLIQVKTLDDAVNLTNQLAPEHCEIMTRGAAKVAEKILTAGAIFLGDYSPTVVGDYMAGPSHTLPTGGAGASFAGLTVDQFQRRTSVVEFNRGALKKSLPIVKKFAEVEGLTAHGRSAEIRS
ncbi:MAG TPA: histidinol dehydrogenase [Verrucomicrobiae bacterium]|jgi:histidinol dehydrogenase|nr:histidinol dehydrogenase [Verrucomicrobiae bacterium]